jgi:hypothetical protein
MKEVNHAAAHGGVETVRGLAYIAEPQQEVGNLGDIGTRVVQVEVSVEAESQGGCY